ncbi:MAG: hypothetical protein GY797_35520 [Deltaproteobacteria bacterium]|nr:hypothetical protein [Deltaproteobacteria bacterium]
MRLTVSDVAVYITNGDGCGRLVGPGKEQLEIIAVMNVGAGVWAFASQPLGEFWISTYICYLLVVRIEGNLPPGGYNLTQ